MYPPVHGSLSEEQVGRCQSRSVYLPASWAQRNPVIFSPLHPPTQLVEPLASKLILISGLAQNWQYLYDDPEKPGLNLLKKNLPNFKLISFFSSFPSPRLPDWALSIFKHSLNLLSVVMWSQPSSSDGVCSQFCLGYFIMHIIQRRNILWNLEENPQPESPVSGLYMSFAENCSVRFLGVASWHI